MLIIIKMKKSKVKSKSYSTILFVGGILAGSSIFGGIGYLIYKNLFIIKDDEQILNIAIILTLDCNIINKSNIKSCILEISGYEVEENLDIRSKHLFNKINSKDINHIKEFYKYCLKKNRLNFISSLKDTINFRFT